MSSKTRGCWCIVCNLRVPQIELGHHLWGHGIVCSDRRQGYRAANGQPPAPLGQASNRQLDETPMGSGRVVELAPTPPPPAQGALWTEDG